jgi:hypothetical protein
LGRGNVCIQLALVPLFHFRAELFQRSLLKIINL